MDHNGNGRDPQEDALLNMIGESRPEDVENFVDDGSQYLNEDGYCLLDDLLRGDNPQTSIDVDTSAGPSTCKSSDVNI